MMKNILIVFLFLFFTLSFANAKNIYINEIKLLIKQYDSFSNERKNYLNNVSDKISLTNKCFYKDNGKEYLISAACFLNKTYPEISFEESVDIAVNYIVGYQNSYELDATIFAYEDAEIKRKDGIFDIIELLDTNHKYFLKYMSINNINFVIPKIYFVKNKVEDYGIYVSSKDLEGRAGCRKENYLKAIFTLDKKIIKSNQKLNYNNILKNIDDYCKYGSSRKYMFYEGVCGASTQLFRLSLINPDIKITKRYPHVYRYATFYDEYIFGDDASVYEMQKQFEIQNISKNDIYLRVFELDGQPMLFSFTNSRSVYISYIIKSQTNVLKSLVAKTVVDKNNGEIVYEQVFKSQYAGKKRD